MQNHNLSLEQIQHLAGEVRSSIPPISIERGMQYFKQGRVDNIEASNSEIWATVRGTSNYRVNLNLNDFRLSRCGCPVYSNCKHMAAVFFYLEENSKKLLTLPKATDSLEKWYLYLKESFQQFGQSYHYIYTYGYYEHFLDELIETVQDWPSPTKELFLFHGCMFTMNKFENFTSRSQYYYNKPGIVTNFSEGFNNLLLDTAKKIALSEVHKQSTTHITSALDKIREYMLQDSYVYFDWLLIYRLLWSNCLAFNNLIELETQILENLSKRKNISAITKYNLILAKAHMHFITGHDQKAMNNLNQTNVKINDVFFYLDYITHNHNWERMEKWLRWLNPRMDMATYAEIGKISTYWLELADEQQNFDEVLDMLKSWLPRSSYAYETALIRGGHYKTWVEYHIFNQSQPTELGRDDIKQVESFDTTLLLPLYHQSVIFLIENKNRISYKNAVRLLKKLKTLYKKIKQLEAWDKYMTTLTNRYSRLRALKEEMRKGNLIA